MYACLLTRRYLHFVYFLLLLSSPVGFCVDVPTPEHGPTGDKRNPVIAHLLRAVDKHTDSFTKLPASLYPSVELMKRYRDFGPSDAIKQRSGGPNDARILLDIVSPCLANAYFSLSQFVLVESLPLPKVYGGYGAFGAAEWMKCFGVEVVDFDKAKLPDNIETILDVTAPFTLEGESRPQRVCNNHLLTLIPGKVRLPDGRTVDFTLDLLGDLLLQNYGGNAHLEAFAGNTHGYGYYGTYLTAANRKEPLPEAPYWLLLPKTILGGSRNKTWSWQQERVNEIGSDYRVPRALEVATSLLGHYARSGERLYANKNSQGLWTFTRCLDVDKHGDPLFVGGFEPSGLLVCSIGNDISGVSCCRKF